MWLICAAASAHALEYRFNCGGDAYETGDGRMFAADQQWTAGNGAGHTSGWSDYSGIPCGGTPDPTLNFTTRINWGYRFDSIPSGTYVVEVVLGDFRIHGPGLRIFRLKLEGQQVTPNIDVFEESRQNRYALRYRRAVEVTDGTLTVEPHHVYANSIISAVSVWDQAPDTDAPAPPAGLELWDGFEQTQLRWEDTDEVDVDGYRVYRAISHGGPYSLLTPDDVHMLRYFDLNAYPGVEYFYYVTTVDVFGNEGATTDTLSATAMERETSMLPLYEIQISDTNWRIINSAPEANTLVPAVFVANGQSYDVEVRYRGSSTRSYAKKSWKVRFLNGVLFNGRDVLNLNAEMPDRSLIREEQAYRLLNEAEVISPTADHIQLFVNDDDYGVYTNVEDLDREFLDRVGLDPDGNLYRAYDRLVVLPDTAAYMEAYEKKTNVGEGYGDLIEFIELLDSTPASDFYQTFLPIFDFENFYHYYATNTLTGNVDFGRDDYYLYHDLVDDYWYWLPWDYNETFGNTENWDETLDYDTTIWPSTSNRLIFRGYSTTHFKQRHLDRLRQLFDTHFSQETMDLKIDNAYSLIEESAHVDWFKWGWEDNTWFDDGPNQVKSFVTLRTGHVEPLLPNYLPDPFLVINEIMASNSSTISDEFGEFDDWIEIHNPTDSTVVLSGFHLTDNYANQFRWALPDTSIPAGGYLVVWCDGDSLQGPMHTNFRLSAAGEVIGLFGPAADGNPAVDTKEFGAAIVDVSFGRYPDNNYHWQRLATPTPGGPNVPYGNIPPQISNTAHEPQLPTPADTVWVATDIWDDYGVSQATLHVNTGTGFSPVPMADDGASNDGAASDGRYGASILPQISGTTVNYYVEAQDDSGGVTVDPLSAPIETYFYTVDFQIPPLFINEFLASNVATNQDEYGEFDDWVEIYNAGSETLYVGGMHLSDELAFPTQWVFPDTLIEPNGFLLVWCDNDLTQGSMHANFKLGAGGEQIGLFETTANGAVPVDTLTFGVQSADISMGRQTDGGEPWVFFSVPTPGSTNEVTVVDPDYAPIPLRLYLAQSAPNPSAGTVLIPFGLPKRAPVRCEIYDVGGRRLRRLIDTTLPAGHHRLSWDGHDDAGRQLPSGVYFYRLHSGKLAVSRKLILTR